MTIGLCRECGAEVSEQSKNCPKCGISNPVQLPFLQSFWRWIKRHPIWSFIIFIILVNIIIDETKSSDSESEVNVKSSYAFETAPTKEKSFKAIITCTLSTGQKITPHSCFVRSSKYGSDTNLKITFNNQSHIYNISDIMRMAGYGTEVKISLPEHFTVIAQNAGQYVILDITIMDEYGNIVFSDQASHYGIISVGN